MSSDDCALNMESAGGARMTGSALIAPLLVVLVSVGCGGGSTSTTGGGGASVSGTIAVGTAPSAVAVDSTTNKIYVTDFGTRPTFDGNGCSPSGAGVTAIDGATQSTAAVGFWGPNPENPFAVTVNPANHTLYVYTEAYWSGLKNQGCGPYLNRIDAFDATTFTQTSSGPPCCPPCCNFTSGQRIGMNLSTGNSYVAGWEGNNIAVLGSVYTLLATIPVGTNPVGVAVNAPTNKIYVANSGSNNISVIDGTSNTVVATVTDPNAVAPVAVAVNATTNTIYVANSKSNNLTVIDGATNAVTATIPVGTAPSGVDVDSQTNFIYVANAGNSGNPGNITVINGATSSTTTLSDPSAKNPSAVAVNSITNQIYVANWNSNNVTVIDGAHD